MAYWIGSPTDSHVVLGYWGGNAIRQDVLERCPVFTGGNLDAGCFREVSKDAFEEAPISWWWRRDKWTRVPPWQDEESEFQNFWTV